MMQGQSVCLLLGAYNNHYLLGVALACPSYLRSNHPLVLFLASSNIHLFPTIFFQECE